MLKEDMVFQRNIITRNSWDGLIDVAGGYISLTHKNQTYFEYLRIKRYTRDGLKKEIKDLISNLAKCAKYQESYEVH